MLQKCVSVTRTPQRHPDVNTTLSRRLMPTLGVVSFTLRLFHPEKQLTVFHPAGKYVCSRHHLDTVTNTKIPAGN